MLRYKRETRPGLVALYDIRPGNGAGQFLQPRSPHGAPQRWIVGHAWSRISSRLDACLPVRWVRKWVWFTAPSTYHCSFWDGVFSINYLHWYWQLNTE